MKNLKLKEVIWEITSKCYKNCNYCGSKDILNDNNPDEKYVIKQVLKTLIDYNVPEINISGGEPGDMSIELLEYVINELKGNKDRKVKIITNGSIFNKPKMILKKIDGFGLSINSKEDIQNFDITLYPKLVELRLLSKTTILTNFGTYNIWEFDSILEFVKANDLHWQIQLNIGKYQLNSEGIEYLYNKIHNMDYSNYILSDNLQKDHICTAGMNSCGITYDGYVIPCLSMRSYDNEKIDKYRNDKYDLNKNSLKDIWENQFKEIRFQGNFKSCRDCIDYPKCILEDDIRSITERIYGIKDDIKRKEIIKKEPPIIMMYGVHLTNDQITYNNQGE